MSRLNAISPGPFDTNRSRGHKRNPASSSSMEDFIRPANNSNVRKHSPQASDASASHRPGLSRSSTNRTLRKRKSMDQPKPILLGGQVSTGRSESAEPYTKEPLPGSMKYAQPPPMLAQMGRSQTSPVESGGPGTYESIETAFREATSERSQAKASLHRPEPSVAAAIRPLDEIGSVSSFRPSKSLRGRKESESIEKTNPVPVTTEARNDDRYQDAPPVPKPNRAVDFGIGNPYHFSTESYSSNDSSGSDVRTASSRSTPPLSGSPHRPHVKAESSRLDTLMNDFRLDLDSPPMLEPPVPPRRGPPPSFSRPMYTRPTEPQRDREVTKAPPMRSLRPAPQDYRRRSDDEFTPSYPLQQSNGSSAPPAMQAPPPRFRKPIAMNKGSCRGCGELICGKSVSSADGRLTGRYHRPCFVCQTCKEPFQTTDFYVISNHPYCARHYHQLNDSLCTMCDRGIEGQYLETEVKQKYHPCCFTCQVGPDTTEMWTMCANVLRRTASSPFMMITLRWAAKLIANNTPSMLRSGCPSLGQIVDIPSGGRRV